MKQVLDEGKLILIAIPVLLWTLLPIYHLFVLSISTQESMLAGKLWPDQPTLQNFQIVFKQQHYYLTISGCRCSTASSSRSRPGCSRCSIATFAAFAIARLKVKGGRHDHEPGARDLSDPGRLPRHPDVQGDGHLRPARTRRRR